MTEDTPLIDISSPPFVIPEIYDWNTSLLSQICREGDIYRLRLFIEYSRQMSSCAKHATEIIDRLDVETGLSPLHHAARHQQLHICLMLLSNINFVFGVNIKDANDRTPIHSAFRSSNHISTTENQFQMETDFGNEIQDSEVWQEEYTTKLFSTDHPLIYLFAKANGDLNALDKYLLTPLHYAVARKNLSGVKQLITFNGKIESSDRQGIRPLHLACKEGCLAIVEYLIDIGVTIDATDADDWTPMHYACAKGHLDIVKLINWKEEFRFQTLLLMKTNTDATCLHLAVQNGSTPLVEYILMKLPNDHLKSFINQQAKPFGTPLHIAAKFSDPPMLDLLYNHGADPFILNSNEQSALHIASSSNRLSIVRELYNLTRTSLLEIKDIHGQTALSLTTQADLAAQLITYGADLSSLDNNHMNAIMIAVLTGQLAIVQHFLTAINDRLLPILHQVEKQNNRSIFLIAVQTGSIAMCSLLLTYAYIHWDTIDKQGMNAWHIAAENNHHELIQFLCHHIRKSIPIITHSSSVPSANLRSYIDAQDEDGKTPLHFASEHAHRSCIEILLSYDADVLLANHLGQLPFHTAIQNGHCQCVDLLIKISQKNMIEFESVLSRRQSPLITACQNGFSDIVQLLISENIGVDERMNNEENPLEIAIKHRQIGIIHILLEHPDIEQWLMSKKNDHQTPLRDLIRYAPDCAQHAFDKMVTKTYESDIFGDHFERTSYQYKYLDDYLMNENQFYTRNSRQLYRNHPLIIALDCDQYFLLEHPLVNQLMARKWKLYRSLFYFPRILAFLLLIILTFYVLITPAPIPNVSSTKKMASSPIRWMIIILSAINLWKIVLEIILYRGLRVPFAQIFGIISFITSILALLPYENPTNNIVSWQWQLTSFSILFQWFNIAVILRSVPFFGHFIVMIESILIKFTFLFFVIFPLLIGFSISISMVSFNQLSFLRIAKALHKTSAIILAELDYKILLFSKSTLPIGTFLSAPFIFMITIVFINLLLGITVGDIKRSMKNAQMKANAYWIRELIYIESILPSKRWLKSNLIEHEYLDHYIRDSIPNNREDTDGIELRKLLDILHMLCIQTKQVLDYEKNFEIMLQQLLVIKKTPDSDRFF